MMTVHKIEAVAATGYSAYLAGGACATRGDYYLGREGDRCEATGTWCGGAARELGLEGEVTRSDLLRVWEGRNPRTGEITVRRSAMGEHVAAVDCTFSAPKSVSVVWAVADPPLRDHIEQAQDQAVLTALSYIEKRAPLVRRRVDGEVTHERAAGLVAARFRHHTSRLSAEQAAGDGAADPQLHDHLAIANMAVRDPNAAAKNGRWAAIDSRELYLIAAEAGAVYRAELAAGMQELGFAVERSGRYFELAGISETVRSTFSSRAHEVLAARRDFIDTYGRAPTAAEAKALTLRSRHGKPEVGTAPFATWRSRAQELGLTDETLRLLATPRRDAAPPEAAARAVVEELSDPASPRSVTRMQAWIDARTLRIAVAEAAQGRIAGRDVPALLDAVRGSAELVRLPGDRWSTRVLVEAETEVVTSARGLARAAGMRLPDTVIDTAVAATPVPLSAEQRAAVRALCGTGGMHLLSAPAGSGKGTVLEVTARAHRAVGCRVIALAAAGETAERLGTQTHADLVRTIDSFTTAVERGTLRMRPTDVVLVDEAALVETLRWRDLLRATRGAATVIAAGDSRQLPAIEAGGMYALLEEELGATRLTENFRATEPWAADAWAALREGRSAAALAELQDRGQVRIEPTRNDARTAAVELWDAERTRLHGRGHEGTVLLLADTSNRDVDALNHLAQQRRLARGEIAGPAVEISTARRDGTTRREHLHPGDEVVLRRTLRDHDGIVLVRNGAHGRVGAVHTDDHALLLDVGGRRVRLGHEQVDAVRLGYARHAYTAQGATVDSVVVLTGGRQTSRESSYVGVSRARDRSYVVADSSSLGVEKGNTARAFDVLASRMAEPRRAASATTLMRGQRRPAETTRGQALAARERYAAMVAEMRPRYPSRSSGASYSAVEVEQQRDRDRARDSDRTR